MNEKLTEGTLDSHIKPKPTMKKSGDPPPIKKLDAEDRLENLLESTRALVKFMSKIKVKAPLISITPDDTLYCSWKDREVTFSVNFKRTTDLKMVYINQITKNHSSKNLNSIDALIEYFDIIDWAKN